MNKMANYLRTARMLCGLFIVLLFTVISNKAVNAGAVGGGERHSIALKEDGMVWGWGDNGSGQVGNGEVGEPQLNPVQVIELTGYLENITAIAAGTSYWLNQGGHTLALKNDGTVWAWGNGLSGQLGDGAGISRSIPVQMVDASDPTGFLTGIVAIGAGDEHSMSVKSDGTVWTCGSNAYGQIGDGTNEETFTPVPVSGLTNATAVTGGAYHTLALKNDGTVWAWGANGSGQLGDGTIGWPTSKTTPVQVLDPADPTGYLTSIVAIASGDEHSLALKSDGTVWAWGGNPFGQLGDGTWGWPESKTTPVQVLDPADQTGYLTGIVAIAGGDDYSLALKGDGTVWGFGRNNWAQLGNGTHDDTNTLVQVSGLTNAVSIAAGNGHSLATKSDGTVWAWGANWSGQLGDGTLEERVTPVQTIFLNQEETKTLLTMRGPHFITPGEEVTYMVLYENILDETLEDAVILFDLPADFTVTATTNNGIYREDRSRVFWILGDVSPGEKGHLAVTMEVAWGLPAHSTRNFVFDIAARNISSNIDIDEYLNVSEISLTSEKEFTKREISTLLAADQELTDFYDYALQRGYNFDDVASQLDYSDGSSLLQLTFIDPETFSPVYLLKADDEIYFENYHQGTGSLFTRDGGYSEDVNDGSSTLWGTWAGGSTQPLSDPLRAFIERIETTTEEKPLSDTPESSQTRSDCINVCISKKVPEWWNYIRNQLKYTGDKKKVRWCFACQQGLIGGVWDNDNCGKCARLFAILFKKRSTSQAAMDASPPLKEHGLAVRKCALECTDNPGKYQCSEDIKSCNHLGNAVANALNKKIIPIVIRRTCVKEPGGRSYYKGEFYDEWCHDGKCETYPPPAHCVYCTKKSKRSFRRFYQVATANNVGCNRSEILEAHDPNAKHVDSTGDVVPGQTLNYTIEFENEGAGTAYDVFILDTLDSDLDETSLIINNGGSYSDVSRILSWEIGEVPPGGQGEVTFSVKVREDLPSGREIINFADVHFPSANEITPTNPVVNTVNTLAADPQTVETLSETPVSIILTGRDSGASTVSYQITSDPLYGTLAGTPPNVSYTSMDEFSGQDEFYFAVTNGVIDSDPAKVTIVVEPNPSDTKPPEVTETYPVDDATNVHRDDTPVSEDPKQYTPTITATFSEPMDSESITQDSFTVDGLTGTVYYDEPSRTGYFIPSSALAVSTTYTVRLGTGIKDKAGNAMASEYLWQFSTVSPVNIEVILPDNADIVDFGDIPINTTSDEKIVSIVSTGTLDLELGTISLAGTDAGEFTVTADNCSGQILSHLGNCTVQTVLTPLATGAKSAYLSIPSNDTEEALLEVTLAGTGVRKGLWPTLYRTMWDGDGNNTLTKLRSFRDNVLVHTPKGKQYVRSMYSNSPEIARLMIQHPLLTLQVRHSIHELLPGIQNLREENSMIVTEQQLAPIELLLDAVESKASPDLKSLIKTIRDDMHTGEMFEQLGIVVN